MTCLIIMQGVKRSPKMFDIFIQWLCAELESMQQKKHARGRYMTVEDNNSPTWACKFAAFITYVPSITTD